MKYYKKMITAKYINDIIYYKIKHFQFFLLSISATLIIAIMHHSYMHLSEIISIISFFIFLCIIMITNFIRIKRFSQTIELYDDKIRILDVLGREIKRYDLSNTDTIFLKNDSYLKTFFPIRISKNIKLKNSKNLIFLEQGNSKIRLDFEFKETKSVAELKNLSEKWILNGINVVSIDYES